MMELTFLQDDYCLVHILSEDFILIWMIVANIS